MTVVINKSIMILDEDPVFCRIYQSIFRRAGYDVLIASERRSGLDLLKKEDPQAVFIEIKIDGSSEEGICFIEEVLLERPNLMIIVVSSISSHDVMSKALDEGAISYIVKSSPDQIESRIREIIQKINDEIRLKEKVEKDGGLDIGSGRRIIGKSPDMWRVYRLIQKVAANRSSALILGESGSGKELIAQGIHALKGEQTPYIPINCGCFQKTLLESELFGVRKKYAGMHNEEKQIGKLETAEAGTLLLDEIGTMEVDLQIKLLRVLEERKFWPLGNEKPLPLRAQVLASTNEDLESAIKEGRFRGDLYHRLNVVKIALPPLHQRKEDIPLLVQYHLDQHEKQSGRRVEILPQAMDKLIDYHWPGNIRELFNALKEVLTIYSLSWNLAPGYFNFLRSEPPTGQAKTSTVDPSIEDLHEKVRGYEKEFLLKTLEAVRWNQTKAAAILNLPRTNFQRKLKQYGLQKENTARLYSI